MILNLGARLLEASGEVDNAIIIDCKGIRCKIFIKNSKIFAIVLYLVLQMKSEISWQSIEVFFT